VRSASRTISLDDAELDDAEAAGLPLAGLIAWQSLVDIAAITAGDRVLIAAADRENIAFRSGGASA
jgi:NADPH:quinone reductase-like Zn-dependent oxidoreductase